MCDVEKASTFDEAKDLLENRAFDVAILDIMGVYGYELLKIAKEKNVIAVIHRNWTNMVEEENLYEITIENRHDLHKELKEIVSRYISDSN